MYMKVMIKMEIKKILIIILLSLVLGIIIICNLNGNTLEKRIDNLKENDIVFVYDSTEQNYPSFYSSIQEIEYFDDVYNLNIKYFDLKGNKKIYQKLKKKDKNFVYYYKPVLYIFKKTEFVYLNNLEEKSEVYKFLNQNNYIDKNNQYEILSAKTFNDLKQKNENSLIVIEDGSDTSFELRKKVFKLSKKYKFKFYSFEPNLITNIDANYPYFNENMPYILIYNDSGQVNIIKNLKIEKIKKQLINLKFIKEEKNEK